MMTTPLEELSDKEHEILRKKNLRDLASALGFKDDVTHWNNELEKLGIEAIR